MRRPGAPCAVLAVSLALSACAHRGGAVAPASTPPPTAAPASPEKVVRIRVPVPVKCVPDDLGPPPAYPDNDQALLNAGGAADRYQLLAAGRLLREERLAKLEEVIRKCRQSAKAPPQ